MKFFVFGKACKVKKVKNLTIDKGATASFSGDDFSITYCDSVKDVKLLHALIHELIHATCDRLGLENTSLTDDVEEIFADNIPEVLLENFDIKVKAKCKRM